MKAIYSIYYSPKFHESVDKLGISNAKNCLQKIESIADSFLSGCDTQGELTSKLQGGYYKGIKRLELFLKGTPIRVFYIIYDNKLYWLLCIKRDKRTYKEHVNTLNDMVERIMLNKKWSIVCIS